MTETAVACNMCCWHIADDLDDHEIRPACREEFAIECRERTYMLDWQGTTCDCVEQGLENERCMDPVDCRKARSLIAASAVKIKRSSFDRLGDSIERIRWDIEMRLWWERQFGLRENWQISNGWEQITHDINGHYFMSRIP